MCRSCCCIASSFYIKPQLLRNQLVFSSVVLHPLSTSNHNYPSATSRETGVVLHPLSTSNHNLELRTISIRYCCIASSFYIKPQPPRRLAPRRLGCIASSFYIKPQPFVLPYGMITVVLHPLSTSNHNMRSSTFRSHTVVLHPLSTSNHNLGRQTL